MNKADFIGIAVALGLVALIGSGCVAKFGSGAVHYYLMNPQTQLGVSRSNQSSGEGNEVWPETQGGATIQAEAAAPILP